jgi:enoyl-CoA hydratase
MSMDEVLFEKRLGEGGGLGIITLNRPHVLNSLNPSMVRSMYPQLQSWAVDDTIKGVVIRAAEGRAFCAGGDLRLTYDYSSVDPEGVLSFFRDEYQLNRLIFHYPKPYIALLDGITMGGGVGISIHGSHRVATERLLFAMPETGIGFFPDVGGSYFLPRLPEYSGFYVGLLGVRLSSDDCVALGLAQNKISRDDLPALIDNLVQRSFGEEPHKIVTETIRQFNVSIQPSSLLAQQGDIEKCFSKQTMEEIIQALQHSANPVCQEAAQIVEKKSPTSMKVSLLALQRGKHLDFDACMRQEFRLAHHFLLGHDFREGIRAVIIDKDQHPHWKPKALSAITSQAVENYFAPIAGELN